MQVSCGNAFRGRNALAAGWAGVPGAGPSSYWASGFSCQQYAFSPKLLFSEGAAKAASVRQRRPGHPPNPALQEGPPKTCPAPPSPCPFPTLAANAAWPCVALITGYGVKSPLLCVRRSPAGRIGPPRRHACAAVAVEAVPAGQPSPAAALLLSGSFSIPLFFVAKKVMLRMGAPWEPQSLAAAVPSDGGSPLCHRDVPPATARQEGTASQLRAERWLVSAGPWAASAKAGGEAGGRGHPPVGGSWVLGRPEAGGGLQEEEEEEEVCACRAGHQGWGQGLWAPGRGAASCSF